MRNHNIENLTLSLLGGIQPSRIKPVIKDAISGAGNDGLNKNSIIQDSLNYLVDYGYLTSTDIPTTDNGDRPTTHYHKHL